MNSDFLPAIKLQFFTEKEILNCGITPSGEWVQTNQIDFIRQPTCKEKANLRAALYWINVYPPQLEQTPQKYLQSYLEAVYHLAKIEAWNLVQQILFLPVKSKSTCNNSVKKISENLKAMDINSGSLDINRVSSAVKKKKINPISNLEKEPEQETSQAFYQQLRLWGFYSEQIEIYQTLLGKISPESDCFSLERLGYNYTCICDYETAIEYYKHLMKLASQLQSSTSEIKALGGLGRCYTLWGKYETALSYCKQNQEKLNILSSETFNNFLDVSLNNFIENEKGNILMNLGYLAYFCRQSRKAIRYFQESLEVVQMLQNPQIEWDVLGGLAICYAQIGKYSQAKSTLEVQFKQLHLNDYQLNASLLNLTTIFLYQSNHIAAIECQQKLISRSQKSGDIRTQCYAWMYIAYINFVQNEDSQVMEPLQKCLTIAQQYHYKHLESQALAIFSCLYSRQKEYQIAMGYAQKSFVIAKSLEKMPRYEAFSQVAFGFAYFAQGRSVAGLRAITTSLILLPPWSSEDGKLMLLIILKRSFFSRVSFL